MITFISSISLFNSAKATKTRSDCWRTAVAEFYAGIITALFFALAKTFATWGTVTSRCYTVFKVSVTVGVWTVFSCLRSKISNSRVVFKTKIANSRSKFIITLGSMASANVRSARVCMADRIMIRNIRNVIRVEKCSATNITFAILRIRNLRYSSWISASRRIGRTSMRAFRRSISKIWCCNLEARVLRCQRKRRGFDSPQHRHGIGRSVAGPWRVKPMTRVRFPSHPPLYLGVAQQ